MNTFFFIIFSSLLVIFFLEEYLEILNLKSLSPKLPKEFQDVYNEKKYKKSQAYTKVNTKFGFITSNFDFALFLSFWFLGGFQLLDSWVRGFTFGPILSGLIFFGVLMVLKELLNIPFRIYSTFVIEEKFGFNKTNAKTFIFDHIKSYILGIIIGGIMLSLILWFFGYFGGLAWFYCFLGVTIFQLILLYVAPTWIMPLFNKYTPLKKGDLQKAIMDYAASVEFPLKGIYVMDGSKRSSKSNAFFAGFGKNKRIVLFDTLIKNHTIPELVSIIAHEVGHYKKKHILKQIIFSTIHTAILFFLISLFLGNINLAHAFFVEKTSIYTGLIFFSLLYSPISFLLGIFLTSFSRKREYEADAFAIQTTKEKASFINALKKLSVHNLSNITPHPLYVFFHYSHPTVKQRIDVIRKK